MFFLKKLLSQAIYPIPFFLFCLFLFTIFVLRSSSATYIKVSTVVTFVIFSLICFKPLPNAVTRSLELKHPSLLQTPSDISTVVVLGGGSCADPLLPTSSQLSSASLIRLTEGITHLNRLDSGRLIVTGGAIFDTISIAELQRKMAIQLGVDSSVIDMANLANDTEQEALAVREMIGEEKIILVTSATHMNRALGLFEKVGLDVIPAPTNHSVSNGKLSPGDFFPSSYNINKLRKSVHELFGTVWSKVRGKI